MSTRSINDVSFADMTQRFRRIDFEHTCNCIDYLSLRK